MCPACYDGREPARPKAAHGEAIKGQPAGGDGPSEYMPVPGPVVCDVQFRFPLDAESKVSTWPIEATAVLPGGADLDSEVRGS